MKHSGLFAGFQINMYDQCIGIMGPAEKDTFIIEFPSKASSYSSGYVLQGHENYVSKSRPVSLVQGQVDSDVRIRVNLEAYSMLESPQHLLDKSVKHHTSRIYIFKSVTLYRVLFCAKKVLLCSMIVSMEHIVNTLTFMYR